MDSTRVQRKSLPKRRPRGLDAGTLGCVDFPVFTFSNSIVQTKLMNRRCEFLLQHVEMLAAMAQVQTRGAGGASQYSYPHKELDRLWKLVLLNQFHDVLPGSSINIVYKDAIQYYKGDGFFCLFWAVAVKVGGQDDSYISLF